LLIGENVLEDKLKQLNKNFEKLAHSQQTEEKY